MLTSKVALLISALVGIVGTIAIVGLSAGAMLFPFTQTSTHSPSTAVVQAALTLQSKIWGSHSNIYDPADPLMQQVTGYWKTYCTDTLGNLCALAIPGNLQCVQFVTAAYWLAGDPLPSIHNAQDFWTAYEGRHDWLRIPSPGSFPVAFVPPQPGDLIVWKGGGFYDATGIFQEYGHIAIVVEFQSPQGIESGTLKVAQANGLGNTQASPVAASNFYQMRVSPSGQIDTWGPYTDENGVAHGGSRVLGFLRHIAVPTQTAPLGMPEGLTLDMPYVRYAWNAAEIAGIDPVIFVRQINQESGFRPDAVSPAGAIGIAQFMPATAAGLSNPLGDGPLNPWDPEQSLTAAAYFMAAKVQAYGDYAQALAAYNAGNRAVQIAKERAGNQPDTWRNFLPMETQHYLRVILGQ